MDCEISKKSADLDVEIDADARLYRKGNTASEFHFTGHTLSDHCHGLNASAVVARADGDAVREATKVMIADAKHAADEDTKIK